MSRPNQTTIDQSITAALHRAGRVWRAVTARRENGLLRLLEAREFSLAESNLIETWLLQHQVGRVIIVLPASAVICRTTTLPDAPPEQLRAALALQAEAHLEGTAPAHRQAMAVLHAAPGESMRTGITLSWPERAAKPELPLSEYVPFYTADIAALAALMNGARSNGPLLWIDRSEGSIALALTHAQGVAFRAASEQGEDGDEWRQSVLRLVAETAINAGHTDEFTDELIESIGRSMTGVAQSTQLLLPEEARAQAMNRVKGAKSDASWWSKFSIAAGALLATLDQLEPLTHLRATPPLLAPSGVDRIVERLSRWKVAAALLITALVMLGIGPLVFSGSRLLVLKWKVGDLGRFRDLQRDRDAQLVMYEELARHSWPMAKLLSDIVNSAPQGITIDSIRLESSGNEVDIRGETDSAETALDFSIALSETRIFDGVSAPEYSESEQGSGNLNFTLTAAVNDPYRQPKYTDDFGELPLGVRLYGERYWPEGVGRRTADADEVIDDAPMIDDIGDGEEVVVDDGEESSENFEEEDPRGRTTPRGPRPPPNIPGPARDGPAAPEMPMLLSAEEIEKLSAAELQGQLLKVIHARNNKSQYTDEQITEINSQYDLLMAQLRSSRGDGS